VIIQWSAPIVGNNWDANTRYGNSGGSSVCSATTPPQHTCSRVATVRGRVASGWAFHHTLRLFFTRSLVIGN